MKTVVDAVAAKWRKAAQGMASREKIHEFAEKYYSLYADPQTDDYEVEEGFAEQCTTLGFQMDCGSRFRETFSEDALYKHEALEKVIDRVDDIALLGSAIFSHWRYVTHWANFISLLDRERRPWFMTALKRLADLTDRNDSVFRGTLRKIQLISNNICFGPCPRPDDEVEQHLTITSDGRVWLSRYRFGNMGNRHERIKKQNFRISAEAVGKIMAEVSAYFSGDYEISSAKDVGTWNLTLTNTDGQIFKITGSLCWWDIQTESGGLSDLIRSALGLDDIFVFDGNPDMVNRVEIVYHSVSRRRPDHVPEGETEKYLIRDCSERITIDRLAGTLEFVREISPDCKVAHTYYAKEDVEELLDQINADSFSEIAGDPPDVIEDPLVTREYTVTVYTKHGDKRTVTGSYDWNGLSVHWPFFIEDVYDLMHSYGSGEIFDEHIYGRAKRRRSDRIYCNVEFKEGGPTYCYLADSDDYREGDRVVVPAGRDNHEAVVRIVSIEYDSAWNAPYPVEKMKHILRRYEEPEEGESAKKVD